MDPHSRAVVGWAIDMAMPAALACEALGIAIAARRPPPGMICHSDRGVQYDSLAYRTLLARHGLVQSMSRKGDCYDNAPMESFFATLKSELIGTARYPDLQHARDQLTAYIDGFYNRHRIHSALNYSTPHAALQHTVCTLTHCPKVVGKVTV
jgi:transposase InsO family protein